MNPHCCTQRRGMLTANIYFFETILNANNGHPDIEIYRNGDQARLYNDRRSTISCCSLMGGNLVTWKKNKDHVVARSSAM